MVEKLTVIFFIILFLLLGVYLILLPWKYFLRCRQLGTKLSAGLYRAEDGFSAASKGGFVKLGARRGYRTRRFKSDHCLLGNRAF